MTNPLLHLPLSSAAAIALGWTLLHALWQGFALVMPAALAMHLLRRNQSQFRYSIGVGTLLAQVIVSAATFAWYYQPALQMVRSSAKTVVATAVSAPAVWPLVSRSLPWQLQTQLFLETHLTQIVVCWLIGVAVFLVRLAGGWLYVQRLRTTALQPADGYWQPMLARLSDRLAIRQSVQVLESAQVLVPMVVGALKPIVLLPIGLATGLSMREAEAILAHELAHIKRFDYAVNLLQSVVEVVFFFHPALWWLSARVREERENCCDDLAVLACGDARSLAQALARVEEFSRTPVLAMALASQKKLLLNRVRRMLGVSARPVVSNTHLLTLTLATVFLATISVYAMQDQPKPRATKSLPTRRHKTPDGTEFSITDNRKVDYVIWKGQKLPAKRVAGLQRQFDKVLAGQLSLDAVTQPDRDILLSIIETNHSFKEGMDGLAKGLSQIDADNMVVTAQNDALANLTTKLADLQHMDYNKIVDEALQTAGQSQLDYDQLITKSLIDAEQAQSGLGALLQITGGNTDSLQAVREQNRARVAQIRLQIEKQRFAAEAIQRKMEMANFDKMRLEQERLRETMKQRQIMMKNRTAQSDSARATIEKQIAENERMIQQQEAAIEKQSQQLIELQNQLDQAQKPIREAEMQLRKLGAASRQSRVIGLPGQYNGSVGGMDAQTIEPLDAPELPEMPEIPDVPAVDVNGYVKAPRRPSPAVRPKIAPAPKPTVNVRPAKPATPAVAPKPTPRPATAPKPLKGEVHGQVVPVVNFVDFLLPKRGC